MARFDINYRSQCLDRYTTVTVLIPDECGEADVPLLYLLHGMHSDHNSWLARTRIEDYARGARMAVVMADAENSYYTNQVFGYDYYSFFAKELPDMVAKWFRQITRDPKKTFVAGLSMGGYGALKLMLCEPHRFAAAASLSGAVNVAERPWYNAERLKIAQSNWGLDFENTLKNTENDLYYLIDQNEKRGGDHPRVYMACGTEDFLVEDNRAMAARFEKNGVWDFLYEEDKGIHDWRFWDKFILRAIDFMLNKN